MTVLRSAFLQESSKPPRENAERSTGPQRSISAAELVAGTFPDREAMIFDALPQATVVAYRDDESLQLNPAARALLGLSAEERLRSIADFHAFLQGKTSLEKAYEGERTEPETIEVRIDGVSRTLNVETAPLFSHGRLAGAVATLRDVTDRALDDEMGDDLLGRAAHDLRTPLTALKASAQLVGRGFERLDPAARTRTLALLLGQIDKLSSRIDDVLDAARIRRGRFDLEPEQLDVATELRQIVADLGTLPGSPPIQLDAQDDLVAKVDRARDRKSVV